MTESDSPATRTPAGPDGAFPHPAVTPGSPPTPGERAWLDGGEGPAPA